MNIIGKTSMVTVVAIIGVILTVAVLIPIIEDQTDSQEYTNEGMTDFEFRKLGMSESVTLTFNNEAGTISDGTNTYTVTANKEISVVYADTFNVRYATSSGVASFYLKQANNEDSVAVTTLQLGGGNATINGSGSPVSYSVAYVVSNDGDYVLSNTPKYVRADTQIIAAGYTAIADHPGFYVYLNGDALNPNRGIYTSNGNYTVSITSFTVTDEEVGDGVYKLTNYQVGAKMTNNGESDDIVTQTLTYSYFLVPATVEADGPISGPAETILWVIPMMILVGMIVMIVGTYYYRE